jgi:DNA-binding NtrC family response regulator
MQALLLRFLENGEIQSVGADTPRTAADVRVLAATNKNLGELVRAGQFREDLLFRLRVIHLHVPPLRERPGDIRPLVDRFLEKLGRPIRLTDAAWRALERYRWPGNVRELQNVVEQIAWLSPDGLEIDVDQLPSLIVKSGPAMLPGRERRRQIADELFQALVGGGYSFWEHIHPLFLQRDITRHDVRELVRRGLSTTRGNYRALLQLFGIPAEDYKRFMNFLAAHGCRADFREFRNASGGDHSHAARPARSLLAPLSAPGGEHDKRDGPRHKAAS